MKKKRSSLARSVLIITAVLAVVVIFVSGLIGYDAFGDLLIDHYVEEDNFAAKAALLLIDGSKLEEYVRTEGESEEYKKTQRFLERMCEAEDVTMIYVIIPEPDYEHFICVFDAVSKNSKGYKNWKVGSRRKTPREEYKEAFKSIYEGEDTLQMLYKDTPFVSTGAHITTFVPVKDGDRITGILCIRNDLDDLDDAQGNYTLNMLIAVIVGTGILVLVCASLLYRLIIRPVELITDAAENFAADPRMPETRLSESVKNNDEIGILAESVDKMMEDTVNNIQTITEATREQQAVATEMDVARKIQCGMVPEIMELKEPLYNVFAYAKPAKSVGGDFYDCFSVSGHKICAVIGDVSGKGVAAALFMSMAKSLMRECMPSASCPSEALSHVNDVLCSSNPEGMFATVFIAVLDTETGAVTYANAGHNKPVIIRGDTELREIEPGIALGLFDDEDFKDEEFRLNKGEGFLIYTDGVTEAVNTESQMYGEERLLNAVKGAGDAKAAVVATRDSVNAFSEGCEPFDDMTVLSVFYTGEDISGPVS